MARLEDPVFSFASAFVDAYAARCPTQATLAGVPGEHAGWDDLSVEGANALREFLTLERDAVAGLPTPTDRWGRVARRVLLEWLDERIAYFVHEDHLSDLNNIESPLQHVRQVFDLMSTTTLRAWETIVTRLGSVDRVLSGYRQALEEGQRRGLSSAERQVRAGIAQARVHASPESGLRALRAAFDASSLAVEEKASGIAARLDDAIAAACAAFGRFADFLEQRYLPNAPSHDPFGERRYVRSAARFLGMKFDPLETYIWGFREIQDIERRMRAVAATIRSGATVAEVIRELEASASERVETTEQFLTLMRERQARALAELRGTHFDVPEAIRHIEVKLAPPGGALGAYYVPPSEDFSRPGTVYYAPSGEKTYTLFSEITTAYHEGFPGHHLQCGLQVYFADSLSRHHRLLVCCSGYAEGWALYAEQLMEELGYYERPSFVLGMLLAKLFRACRIIADIGMHLELEIPKTFDFHPGEVWDWDLCVELLATRGFIDRAFAESEATRYLGWPGQAISYKVGERVILDLREEMRATLGSRFDLKKFHEAVLSAGSVGLDHLRDIVRETLAT